MGISYVSIIILVLLVSLFYQIGDMDEKLSSGLGMTVGVLVFLFCQFVLQGGLLYLVLSVVGGFGLLTFYKIIVTEYAG
jgi:VIT1/CCC1 family predicted Fe2+/Mn2+ transporter